MKLLPFIILLFKLYLVNGQDSAVPTWSLHEIQIFNGKTPGGTHIIKIDKSGLLLRKINLYEQDSSIVRVVSFMDLEGNERRDFKTNYYNFLQFIGSHDLMSYESVDPNYVDTLTRDSSKVITRKIDGFHSYRKIKLLIIDSSYNSHLIICQFEDELMKEFIQLINNIIPKEFRESYQFNIFE